MCVREGAITHLAWGRVATNEVDGLKLQVPVHLQVRDHL